ncbi:MAG: hypothetical protein COC05_04750 [Gammaproteobacteria bacterium]|nr:MAG: hypothetical protein COC05_04750 [Gammaproteobacteria bacterium]
MRKMRKVLLFVIFLGFALVIRAAIDYVMGEPINITLTLIGFVILVIGVVAQRLFLQKYS